MQKTSQLLHSHFDVVLLYKQIGYGLGGEEKAHVLKSINFYIFGDGQRLFPL